MRSPSFVYVLACAAGIFAVMMGLRMAHALFIGPINSHTGLGIVAISLAFAIGQIVWGLAQPVAGILSDRIGFVPVVAGGILLVGIGTALASVAQSTLVLVLAIGVLVAFGAGAAGPSMLLGALGRLLPPERRAMANGIVNAGGSLGQFALVPLTQLMIGWIGWMPALWLLAMLACAVLPLVWPLGRSGSTAASAALNTEPPPFRRALREPSYLLLNLGFFTCGFHVAFIATHLPGVVETCALPAPVSAWSLAVIGLFNMAGSLGAGWALSRGVSAKWMLSGIYASRALAVAFFLLAPKVEATFLIFSVIIGLSYLSTVPPTAGLVSVFYGARNLPTLFGVVMLSHQVGGFLGAYGGGKALAYFGSFDLMWYADITLALLAAAAHLPIREASLLPAPQAARA
jgi:predicted MFS family arabinose efflux permease